MVVLPGLARIARALPLGLAALAGRLVAQDLPGAPPPAAESAAAPRRMAPLVIEATGGPGFAFGIAVTHNQSEIATMRAATAWVGARVMLPSTLEWQPGIEAGYYRFSWQGPWDNRAAGAVYLGIVAQALADSAVSVEYGAGMYRAGDAKIYPGALLGVTFHPRLGRLLELPIALRIRPLLFGGIILPVSLSAGLAVPLGR